MTFPLRSCVVYNTLALLCLSGALPARAIKPTGPSSDSIVIPGPLRSFLRMAGVSQQVTPAQVLPEVALNVSLLGYQTHRPTEFLILLNRYVHQARELADIAGPDGEIRVAECNDAGRLISVLGYRMRGACGQHHIALVTADPERAFLTIDSGFPLTQFEEALNKNTPFNYPYPQTRVPIFYTPHDWANVSAKDKREDNDLLLLLLRDQSVDNLYAALSHCDEETRLTLLASPGVRKLVSLSGVFSLYGSGIDVLDGKVVVPGNDVKGWEELVGARVTAPGEFIFHLLSKDRGWLAAYYDVMARISQSQQAHLTADGRLKTLYEAYRASTPRFNASDGVFPRNAELLILYTSLQWEPNGTPSIHESLEAWGSIFGSLPKSEAVPAGRTHEGLAFDTPEHFLELLVAQTNLPDSNSPVQAFFMLEAINAGKPAGQRLSTDTDKLIADRLPQFSPWFQIFAEFPQLDDASVTHFVNAADHISGISIRLCAQTRSALFRPTSACGRSLLGRAKSPRRN